MYGLIFHKLKQYCQARYGREAWERWLKEAGLTPGTVYMPGMVYPDDEIVALLHAATVTHPVNLLDLLDDFGAFVAPELLETFPTLIEPEWKTLDLLEHIEPVIHKMVRLRINGVDPPRLVVERKSPTQGVIVYTSARRMCHFLKGVVRGTAEHYGEKVTISEQDCMLEGDDACRIMVEVANGAA